MSKKGLVFVALSLLVCAAMGVEWAIAFTAASGYAATNFATGFASVPFGSTTIGPIGLAFDASGNLFVGNPVDGFLYKFGPTGGVASTATQLNTTPIPGAIVGLAFTKDGRLYLARRDAGDVLEINASSGAVIRTVASIVRATGLATDPLSGDLFVSQTILGGNVFRISNFTSGPGTVTPYAATPADGIAFGPDGTLYAAIFTGVAKIAGTNAPTPGVVTVVPASVPFIDGMAVSANPNTPFLYGNRNDGIITKIDLTTSSPTLTNIFTGGTRGDFAVVGFDGCLYATQSDRIVKVTNADGTCVPPPLGPLTPTGTALAFLDSGSFVIGDLDAVPGNAVTFWGAQWAKVNSLSGGPAPHSFKGFADTAPRSCGGGWASDPGNSSNPPDSVPPLMAVIASSSISKSGPAISGDVPKIVIIKTNPGYGPAPGHTGTGTVVAVLCSN